MSCAACDSSSSCARPRRLALQQLGALERERREAREDLRHAQVLLAQRRPRRARRQRQHAERAPARGAHRTGDERRRAIPLPRRPRGRRAELGAQPRAQRTGALPARHVGDQDRLAALDRGLRDAAALGVVRSARAPAASPCAAPRARTTRRRARCGCARGRSSERRSRRCPAARGSATGSPRACGAARPRRTLRARTALRSGPRPTPSCRDDNRARHHRHARRSVRPARGWPRAGRPSSKFDRGRRGEP